jgi:hypothetical protein
MPHITMCWLYFLYHFLRSGYKPTDKDRHLSLQMMLRKEGESWTTNLRYYPILSNWN